MGALMWGYINSCHAMTNAWVHKVIKLRRSLCM
jgi:hypothetical protein